MPHSRNYRHGIAHVVITVCLLAWAGFARASITTTGATTDPSLLTPSAMLIVGDAADGTMTVDDGSDIITGTGYVGYKGGTGHMTVDGAGSTWTTSQYDGIYIGYGGTGTMTITHGAVVSDDDGGIGGILLLAQQVGTGTVTVDGTNSTWNNGELDIMDGTLNIENGGQVNAGLTHVVTTLVTNLLTTPGQGTIHFNNGTLNTHSLFVDPSHLTGTGVVNTNALVSNLNLIFDQTHGLQQQLTFNSQAGQNITVNLTVDGTGQLGAGYYGQGSLIIRDGVTVNSTIGEIGDGQGSVGVATVDGTGSTWNNTNGGLYAGYGGGDGTINIINGGTITSYTGYIAYGGQTGTVNVDGPGSIWLVSHELYVGYPGNGTLNITNGGQVHSLTAQIGQGFHGQIGQATVAGHGSLWINGGQLDIGIKGSIGVLTITNDATVQLGGDLTLASNETLGRTNFVGSGTINLEGGTLDMQGHGITAGDGVAVFNFTGGTLKDVSTFGLDLLQQGGALTTTSAVGGMTIQGNYTLDDLGALLVELADSDLAGNNFELYSVNGAASLHGVLQVFMDSGFTAGHGEAFDVLTADSIDTSGLTISPDYDFSVISGGNGQILQITATPEPATLALLALGGLGLLIRRRRGEKV